MIDSRFILIYHMTIVDQNPIIVIVKHEYPGTGFQPNLHYKLASDICRGNCNLDS